MSPIRPVEARLLEVARQFPGQRIAGTTVGRGQALASLAAERPDAAVVVWMMDAYRARLVRDDNCAVNLRVDCRADVADESVDLALASIAMAGEAELTRDALQQLLHRLALGGTLVAASDNPRDTWLGEQLATMVEKVQRIQFADAAVYCATKTEPLRRIRDFTCEFAMRDRGRLLTLVSRPGVFSHRRVDPGARQLLNATDVGPGERILDIGCGAGTVAIGLAAREPSATVLAVDSHARAVECTRRGAELNGLGNVTALVNADGDYPDVGTFDLAVTNPPYYADHDIAVRMLAAAHRSLHIEGRLAVVTKSPGWYAEHLPATGWQRPTVTESRRYFIIAAERGP